MQTIYTRSLRKVYRVCQTFFFYQVYIITPPRLAELCDRSFVILSFIRSVREQDNSRMR